MIKVTVLYPNEPDKAFDMDYYLTKHMPMVHRLLDPAGLVGAEAEKGISSADPSSPAPFVVAAHLLFNTVEEVHSAFMTHGREIMGDIANYTAIKPQIQISEIIT